MDSPEARGLLGRSPTEPGARLQEAGLSCDRAHAQAPGPGLAMSKRVVGATLSALARPDRGVSPSAPGQAGELSQVGGWGDLRKGLLTLSFLLPAWNAAGGGAGGGGALTRPSLAGTTFLRRPRAGPGVRNPEHCPSSARSLSALL